MNPASSRKCTRAVNLTMLLMISIPMIVSCDGIEIFLGNVPVDSAAPAGGSGDSPAGGGEAPAGGGQFDSEYVFQFWNYIKLRTPFVDEFDMRFRREGAKPMESSVWISGEFPRFVIHWTGDAKVGRVLVYTDDDDEPAYEIALQANPAWTWEDAKRYVNGCHNWWESCQEVWTSSCETVYDAPPPGLGNFGNCDYPNYPFILGPVVYGDYSVPDTIANPAADSPSPNLTIEGSSGNIIGGRSASSVEIRIYTTDGREASIEYRTMRYDEDTDCGDDGMCFEPAP